MNPYVFLVGCPRSGTTLLGRICHAHPELAVVHESRWIARWYESGAGLTQDGRVTRDLVAAVPDRRLLDAFGIEEDEFERLVRDREGAPFASVVTALYERYGRLHGARLVGDKSPGYVRYLPTLHRFWPQARFVHIVRDGRDVCLSALEWGKGATRFSTFRENPFATVGVWWEWYVRLGLEAGRHLETSLYHELRYEALVAEPERAAREVCAFLGVPFDRTMLRFHEGRTAAKPGLSAKSSWMPVTRGLRDWRTHMRANRLVEFEAAAGELLDELGYERAAPTIPPAEAERAARVREVFVRELEARARPVPQAWTRVPA